MHAYLQQTKANNFSNKNYKSACVLNDQFNELGIFENPKLSKFKLNKKLSGIGTRQKYVLVNFQK